MVSDFPLSLPPPGWDYTKKKKATEKKILRMNVFGYISTGSQNIKKSTIKKGMEECITFGPQSSWDFFVPDCLLTS
jgi:hypothetical protein